MSQYQVPQNVEAEDKLLGPFTFRQFVYLLIAAGMIALAVILFRIFPLLAILPVPVILLFGALALPLKKDQPMETYLAAIVSFHIKPRNRLWTPGQPDTDILITAPKKVEANRVRTLGRGETSRRLSFLADIVDSEGYAIKGASINNNLQDDVIAEANQATDIFESVDPIQPAYDTSQEDFVPVRTGNSVLDSYNKIISRNSDKNIFKASAGILPSSGGVSVPTTPIPRTTTPINSDFTPPSLPQKPASTPTPTITSTPTPTPTPQPIIQPQNANAKPENPAIINSASSPISEENIPQTSHHDHLPESDEEVYVSLH